MLRHQFIGAQTEALGRARRKILDKHIRVRDEFRQYLFCCIFFDIQCEAFLIAVKPQEIPRLAQHFLIVTTGEIADFGPFDFDHARALLRELTRADRRGDGLFQGDYGKA